MNNLNIQIDDIAKALNELCSYIDIREDENGSYILAFGIKGTHSLQFRKSEDMYILELWQGKNAEEETLMSEPIFPNIESAFAKAKTWLENDAI